MFISQSDTVEISHNSVNHLSDVFITESEVFEPLSSLKPNKTPGPNNLHPHAGFTINIVLEVWSNRYFYYLQNPSIQELSLVTGGEHI